MNSTELSKHYEGKAQEQWDFALEGLRYQGEPTDENILAAMKDGMFGPKKVAVLQNLGRWVAYETMKVIVTERELTLDQATVDTVDNEIYSYVENNLKTAESCEKPSDILDAEAFRAHILNVIGE